MDNHLLKGILLFLLLPAIIVPAEMARTHWRNYSEFQNYYENLSITMADIAAIDKSNSDILTKSGFAQWQQQANNRLQKLYSKESQYDSSEITQSIELTRKVFEEIARHRQQYADIIEPLASSRMQDHQTVNDQDSYQWRLQTLNNTKQSNKSMRLSDRH